MELLERLKERFPKIKRDEPLKNHCTLRVGGPADLFYELAIIEELPALVELAEENSIPYCVVGRGTNVLFADKGFRGLVIKNLSDRCAVNGNEITADSGVLLGRLVRLSVDNHLTGLEHFYGIPGTIGGAVYGNAGVPEAEIGRLVKTISVFNASDGVRDLPAEKLIFKYRWSSLQETRELILRVVLKLKKGDSRASRGLMQKINEIRRGKQPAGYCAGSFFKNPAGDRSTGWLIEHAGLKGKKIGDAQISEKHGNFIMNTGHASCAQILELAKLARQKVKDRFKIDLEMEVKTIGDL